MTTPVTATVDVTPALLSKVNWTAVVGAVSSLCVFYFGTGLTVEQQAAVVVVINLVQSGLIVLFKTRFTDSVHPSSLK